MTEFEEITFKKIIKGKMIGQIYVNLNVILGNNSITNAEISTKIGWDPAGYNQKLNRLSDLRISTFLNICAALMELSTSHREEQVSDYEKYEELDFTQLITFEEYKLALLFLHISDVADGKANFLDKPSLVKTFKSLKTYLLGKRTSSNFSEQQKAVYFKYYNELSK